MDSTTTAIDAGTPPPSADQASAGGGLVARSDAPQASARTGRPRLLLISTWQIPCGIAHTAETVHTRLRDDFDIEVFALDQYIFRGDGKAQHAAAEKAMDALCERIAAADVVNLQWEPGLLAPNTADSLRRFRRIVGTARNMVITVHTVLPVDKWSPRETLGILRRHGPFAAIRHARQVSQSNGRRYYEALRAAQDVGNLTLVVHTKREVRFFRDVAGIRDVRDHPLSHIPVDWWETLEADRAERRQALEAQFGQDRVFCGFFGFLSPYKGIETAIEAIKRLPLNHVLLIYGQVHPSNVRKGHGADAYLQSILKAVDESNKLSGLKAVLEDAPLDALPADVKENLGNLVLTELNQSTRIRFMGSPDSYDFAVNMAACDVCVFPYLEVGQSASGPAAIAVEMGKPVLASTSKTFVEMNKYFPDRMRFFDIGNFIQLAQFIETGAPWSDLDRQELRYDGASLGAFYRKALLEACEPGVKAATQPGEHRAG